MAKRLAALIMCFCMMASLVGAAPVWTPDIPADPKNDDLVILLTAVKASPNIYDEASGTSIESGMNLFNRDLMTTVIGSTLDFQVFISSWADVWSLDFISTDTNVASISGIQIENGSRIFSLTAKGNGEASVFITLNGGDPQYAFSISVEGKVIEDKDVKKEVPEVSYESVLAAAKKNMPNVYIVNSRETIVNTDSFDIGESRIYHMAVKAENWVKSSALEYCFYASNGYYFYLDTDEISWSVPEKYVSWYREGKGVSMTGVNSGGGTLRVSVPVCVMYVPERKSVQMVDGWPMDYPYNLDRGWEDSADPEFWDITTLTADASITVNKKKPEKKPEVVVEQPKRQPPYNPFAGIDISKVANPFSDVSHSDWFYEPLMYVYAAGLLNGVDIDGHNFYYDYFSMDAGHDSDPGRRTDMLSTDGAGTWTAEITRFLSGGNATYPISPRKAENRQNTVHELYNEYTKFGYQNVASYTYNPFIDVSSSSKAFQSIMWASQNKIVLGYGDKRFGPQDNISREQFCTILVRHAAVSGITLPSKYSVMTFTDSNMINDWARNNVEICQRAGIINGYPDGSFKPQGEITRSEIAKMIYEYGRLAPNP